MNKSIFFAPLVLAALSGCNPSPEQIREQNEKLRSRDLEIKSAVTGYEVLVWTDTETGRDYVIVSSGSGVAVTPRLHKE